MADKLILGEEATYSTDIKKTGLNNNIAVIGCTGSGKTLSIIEPRLLNTYESNLIIYDPKRELIDKYETMFCKRRYEVNELNLSQPELSDLTFDPLCFIKSHSDVNTLAKAIVNLTPQNENSSADRYWDDCACNLAKFGIYYVLTMIDNPIFTDFLEFINELQIDNNETLMKTSVDSIVEDIKQDYPNHPMITPYNSIKVTPTRTAGCIFSTLKTTLSDVFNEDIRDMIRKKKKFDIQKFIKQKSVLFITSDGNNDYVNAFANLIFETIINELSKEANCYTRKTLPIPVHLILDDFACGTTMKSFPRYISAFRSKGISCTIVLQSESQLSALYGEASATTILNNADTLVYLGGNDKNTAKNFSERLNVPLDKVLYMPVNKILIFRRGSKPIVTNRYPIYKDRQFIKINSDFYSITKSNKIRDNNIRKKINVDTSCNTKNNLTEEDE